MKNLKGKLIFLAIVLLLTMMTACGGSGTSAESTTASDQAAISETIEETTESLPSEDQAATEDSVIGNWIQSDDTTRFANISKNDSGIVYEDPEGTYNGTFDKGVLTVKVNETETAKVFFDKSGNRLVIVYQDSYTYFTKK